MSFKFITNEQLYKEIIEPISKTKKYVWIGTADIKDFKHIVIDGELAYTGSANLTGAGLGMKSPKRRNFESGIVTTNPELIDHIMAQFDSVWIGKFCKDCGRKQYCSDPIA